jgi:hypothetical protein
MIPGGPDGPLLVPTKTRRSYRVALDAASLELLRRHHQATSTGGGVMAPENRFVFSSDETGTPALVAQLRDEALYQGALRCRA